MSAHVLLILKKRYKMLGLPSILSLLHDTFNKFNITRARIYLSYDLKNTLKSHFWPKTLKCYNFISMYVTLLWTS